MSVEKAKGSGYHWGSHLPTLSGERVRLVALYARDIPALFRVFSDPEVMRYWLTPPMRDESEAAEYLEKIQEGFRTKTLFQWGVNLDGAIIGTCTLFELDFTHRRGEIGYALARAYWGRGLAKDALTALVDFAFTALELHRIEADVDPRNENSIRLLERLGFCREGCQRERYIVGGEIQDALLLGLLRPEWRRPTT
ncbi:MAG TPA: GNAT family N-acetyltransferase [Candidatus Eisenbacteria bacterium]|nr:GNAT family N-acetyltransferase [Candidatus Eisenbacteria bacterium]